MLGNIDYGVAAWAPFGRPRSVELDRFPLCTGIFQWRWQGFLQRFSVGGSRCLHHGNLGSEAVQFGIDKLETCKLPFGFFR